VPGQECPAEQCFLPGRTARKDALIVRNAWIVEIQGGGERDSSKCVLVSVKKVNTIFHFIS